MAKHVSSNSLEVNSELGHGLEDEIRVELEDEEMSLGKMAEILEEFDEPRSEEFVWHPKRKF
jgi:hypothetical protein